MVYNSRNNVYKVFLFIGLMFISLKAFAGFEIKEMDKSKFNTREEVKIEDVFSDIDMFAEEETDILDFSIDNSQSEELPMPEMDSEEVIVENRMVVSNPDITDPILNNPVELNNTKESVNAIESINVIPAPVPAPAPVYAPVQQNPSVDKNIKQNWRGSLSGYSGGHKYEDRVEYDLKSYIPKEQNYSIKNNGLLSNEAVPSMELNNIWSANKGDSLRSTLEKWSSKNGFKLIWSIEYDYELADDFELSGSFENAVEAILNIHKTLTPQPFGEILTDGMGAKSLIISSYN